MKAEAQENVHYKTAYISVLSVVSAFSVVMLHFNGVFWSHPAGHLWITANIIESIFYFAVPVFFMISGCTLIDYRARYSTKTYFCKRIRKTLIPFFIWSMVAYVYCSATAHSFEINPFHVLIKIFNYKYLYIYWFFIPLFSIYMCIPVLNRISDKVRIFPYMLVLAFVFNSINPWLNNHGVDAMPQAMTFPICAGYLIYPVLGYVLRDVNLSKRFRTIIYVVGMASLVVHFTTTLNSDASGPIVTIFKDYLCFTTVLYATAIFVFFKYNSNRILDKFRLHTLLNYIKPTTLGIYLTHIYVYDLICRLGVPNSSWVLRTAGAMLSFIALAAIIRVMQKTKVGRVLLPL